MKYKIGDTVKIKSAEWYDKYRNQLGDVECAGIAFTKDMSAFCGAAMTIVGTKEGKGYRMDGTGYVFTDEMIKGKVDVQ